MSDPIILKNAGDKHTMDVASCGELPFGRYKEYEFVGRDGSKVRVPKVSAERQLGRLSLTAESVVGRRVTIKRDPNAADPTKNFWGLYLEESGANGNGTSGASNGATAAGGQQAAREVTPAATTQPAPPPREKRSAIYLAQTQWVLDKIVPLYEAKKISVNANDVHAMVAVLFIAETRN